MVGGWRLGVVNDCINCCLISALMDRTLKQLGVKSGAQLEVDDFVQELKFKILVFHSPDLEAQQFEIKRCE